MCLTNTQRYSLFPVIIVDFESNYDATVVSKLKSHGAIIVGKTNMDEFGMGSYNLNTSFGSCVDNRCLNSQGFGRVVGGSSGGSAASVLFGTGVASIGTDTGGSVRNPASHCKLFGFKPSYGAISRFGLMSYAHSLDTIGIIGQHLNDIEIIFCKSFDLYNLFLAAIRGQDSKDMTSIEIGASNNAVKEIGILCPHAELNPLFKKCFPKFNESFVQLPVCMPNCDELIDAYYTIVCCEAYSNLARYNGIDQFLQFNRTKLNEERVARNRKQLFGGEVFKRISMGMKILQEHSAKLMQSYELVNRTKEEFSKLFEKYSFLVTLTTTNVAPYVNEIGPKDEYYADCLNIPISLAGLPSLSVPLGKLDSDSELSIQIIAPYQNDLSIFHLLTHNLSLLQKILGINPTKNA